MKTLYANLEEALQNLDRARRSLDDMFRCGVGGAGVNHMSASVKTWASKVAAIREEIQNALAAEGAASVEVEAVAVPTPAELMTAKIEAVRQIASEEITITRGELHNLISLAAAELRRQEVFDKTHSSNAIKGEHETARRIYDRTDARFQELGSVDLSIYYANKGWTAIPAQTAVAS